MIGLAHRSDKKVIDINLPDRNELSSLLEGCVKNNIIAQRQLYQNYMPFVFGVIKRYVDDDAIAEELLNDTFITIYSKLHQFSFKGSFEGWIRRIAVNIVGMYFRRNIGYHKNTVTKDFKGKDESGDFFIDEDIVGKISHKEILRCIYELPQLQRLVFNLFVLDNFSHKEIAALLSITDNYSRWLFNNARKLLKEKITMFL